MKYIKAKTKIPVPEVYAYALDNENRSASMGDDILILSTREE
jgi:hypothetical protein